MSATPVVRLLGTPRGSTTGVTLTDAPVMYTPHCEQKESSLNDWGSAATQCGNACRGPPGSTARGRERATAGQETKAGDGLARWALFAGSQSRTGGGHVPERDCMSDRACLLSPSVRLSSTAPSDRHGPPTQNPAPTLFRLSPLPLTASLSFFSSYLYLSLLAELDVPP
ncbi:hypothetical protein OH76DRAFT_589473 [Lentinus brumalis]|uniref:Uncharacterized protein n=1 Tax=Lentinus brumalis TaxID=2498619 RepID=A0A371DU30_9APHY|nr:hypothetical protein OH76DRAFT_589473 [Polyporus brumalis]